MRGEIRAGRLDAEAGNPVLRAAGQTAPFARRILPAGLTERETEVRRLLARGGSKRTVAEQLSIIPKTARNHAQHIYEKLGVSTRAAAALFAVQHGLIDSPVAP